MESLIDRFLRYVSIDTMSDHNSQTSPTTERQLVLARLLKQELEEIGMERVTLDENGYVMASLPGNADRDIPAIGFIAHIDTSPDMSGADVRARIVEYTGGPIILNEEKGIVLDPLFYPEILKYKGEELIVTDGTTLLGADDKAGVAEIITAMEYLIAHPEIEHGKIVVCFTPDEEVGKGTAHFDLEEFGADFAYTVDGGAVGQLQYETFNAAGATVKISGLNIHPGAAKGKMKNSMLIATEFIEMLPATEVPSATQDREGFFHLVKITGTVEETCLTYIIRDHDGERFEKRKNLVLAVASFLNVKYGEDTVSVTIEDSYRNMREKIEPVMFIVDRAARAMKNLGIEPIIEPIRGGTDGARLSFQGLPTPNIFTGGHNFHGRYEYIPISSMKKAVEVIVEICRLFALESF